MPFQKRNTLWKKGVASRKANSKRIEDFLIMIASGGIDNYGDILDKLAANIKLSEQEIQFLDRIEKWIEYIKPKLARQDSNINLTGGIKLLDLHGKAEE